MSKSFLFIERGGHLALRFLPDKALVNGLANHPRLSLTSPPKTEMTINATYQDVPYVAEKIKNLKSLIKIEQAAISRWKSTIPPYELLGNIREQLARNQKLLKEITEVKSCL